MSCGHEDIRNTMKTNADIPRNIRVLQEHAHLDVNLGGRKVCHVGATSLTHQWQNDGQCHMATNFILSNGDVEDDVVPPNFDVTAQKSDVDPGKNDVACHVSRVLGGFHLKNMFRWTSRGT